MRISIIGGGGGGGGVAYLYGIGYIHQLRIGRAELVLWPILHTQPP